MFTSYHSTPLEVVHREFGQVPSGHADNELRVRFARWLVQHAGLGVVGRRLPGDVPHQPPGRALLSLASGETVEVRWWPGPNGMLDYAFTSSSGVLIDL